MNILFLKLKKIALTTLLLICPVLGFPQTKYIATFEEVEKTADLIVSIAAQGSIPAALTEMRQYSGVPAGEFNVLLAQMDNQNTELFNAVGRPTGYEVVRTEKLGTSLVKYSYIIKCTQSAIIWKMTFYKASKGWVVVDFNFSSKGSLLFVN